MAVSSLTDSLNRALGGASMYEAPGMSGAAGFGFSPGQSESAWLRDRALRQQTYALDIGRESMRNQAFANILAQNRPDNSWRQSGMQVFSTMMNSPQFAAMTGGSDFDLFAGAQAVSGASGFRIGGARTFGGGALADRVAYDIWKTADASFFDRNGIARMEQTQGFDRTQLGQLFSLMGQRGAWAGMNLGGSATMKDGKYEVNYDAGSLAKIPEAMTEAAKALRVVQDVVGGRPMQEVLKIAENIAGLSAGSAQFASQVQKRMAGVMSMSSFGINPMAAMNFQGSVAQGLTQLGFSGTAAAAISPDIMRNAFMNQQSEREFAKTAGFYMTPMSASAGAAGLMTATAALKEDHKMQAFALGQYMADKGLIKNDALLADLRQNTPSEASLDSVYQRMMVASGGNVVGALDEFGGMDKVLSVLSPGALDRYSSAGTNVLLDRSVNNRLRSKLMSQGTMLDQFTGDASLRDAAIEEQVWLASTLTRSNQGKFVEIVGSAATDLQKQQQLTALITGDRGAEGMSSADVSQRVAAAMRQSSHYGRAFGLSAALRETDEAMSLSKGDRAELNRIIDLGGNIFENQTPVGDMTGDMLRGFFNSATPDPEKLMRYGMMTGDITTLDPSGINGDPATQTKTRDAVRAMIKAANPGISEGELSAQVSGAWKDLQAGGTSAAKRVEDLGRSVQANGGLARRKGGVMYTMSKADKEHKLANWSTEYEAQAFEDVQRSLGVWSPETGVDKDYDYRETVGAALYGPNKDFTKLSVLDKERVGQAAGVLRSALTADMNNAKTDKDKAVVQKKLDAVNDYMASGAAGGGIAMSIVSLMRDILEGIKGIGSKP